VFSRDPIKAARNLAKHGVAFERAWDFDWATSVVVDRSRRADGERRQANRLAGQSPAHGDLYRQDG
jgi:uncharacterized DUF497 family protein